MEYKSVCLIITHVLLGCFQLCQCVEVHTNVGTIVGTVNTVTVKDNEYRVKSFRGIPYAKPPTGNRRWQKPEEMDAFDTPFQATDFGYACPQNPYPGMHSYTTSEDCLTLNVFVPDQKPDKTTGHAVMVLIHGGGFNLGAAQTYGADRVVSFGNVIMVTINYRLGVFGFMDSGDGRIPGNLGFHDQHLALKWVNKNIGEFGGDNSRVTIFGESAGGTSALFQGLYTNNRGLFQRVISESGAMTANTIFVKNPKETFDLVSKELGCTDNQSGTTLDCLKAVETQALMGKINDFASKQLNPQFMPTVDGEIIQIAPYDLTNFSQTQALEQIEFYRSLDVVIGFNNAEGAMFLMHPVYAFEDTVSFTIPREDFVTKAVPGVLSAVYGTSVHDAISSLVVGVYTNWTDPNLPENNRDQYIKLWGDVYFSIDSVEFTRLHANSSGSPNSYAYYFTALSTNHLLKTPVFVKGATHGDELNYVFMFDPELNRMTEDLKPFADWEYDLSYRMVSYWTNFAKSGNPNEPVKISPIWPQYDLTDQRYINLNKDMSDESVQTQLYAREANLWLKTVPEVMEVLSHDHDASSPFVKTPDGSCD